MERIPEGLIVEAKSFAKTAYGDVLKPVFGNVDSLPAEFKVVKVYSASDSEYQGVEVEQEVEVCVIHSDKFSKVPLRVAKDLGTKLDKNGVPYKARIRSELSRQQEQKLAPLYERFKKQKDSTDTNICDWQAAGDDEKAFLASLGIWTVEQLNAMPEYERYRLGPSGDELWKRSERHMCTKEGRKRETATEEMLMVLEENKSIKQQMREQEQRMYEMQQKQEQLMALMEKRKGGRPRKNPEERQAA